MRRVGGDEREFLRTARRGVSAEPAVRAGSDESEFLQCTFRRSVSAEPHGRLYRARESARTLARISDEGLFEFERLRDLSLEGWRELFERDAFRAGQSFSPRGPRARTVAPRPGPGASVG